jgi:SH3-like domain-containing protein
MRATIKKLTAILSIAIFVMVVVPNCSNALCVKVPKANLRSGPGTNYEKVWEVYKYMPFKKVGTSLSGDWYAVRDVDGDVNWIYKKLVTNKYRCAVVKAEKANIRKGPGTHYHKSFLSPVKQYYSFKILQRKGVWLRVMDEWHNVGWIHSSLLWIN